MGKFSIKLLAFLIPFIILLSIPTYILWQSKENFYVIDKTVAGKQKYLIGYAYHENNYDYLKWADINLNDRRAVWTLGSSSVLQFREQMFTVPFYNAGYTILSIYDFRQFLKNIPENKYPGYLIIGLNHFMFNASSDYSNSTKSLESWQNNFTLYPNLATYKQVYKDLFAGKYTLRSFQNDTAIEKIGLNAIVNNKGFRKDGSMDYGVQISKLINHDTTANDYNYSNTFDRIKHGDRRFQYCNFVNEKAVLELNELLDYCKLHKIHVTAFLPPFADKVYDKMIESNNYNYLIEIYSKIKPVFDKYHYEVYDFSKVSLCESSDNETIDGMHGGEITYQRILIAMLDSGSVLNKVSNVQRLKIDLSNKKNNYTIYSN